MPSSKGTSPPRRAGHSAMAMGCQLIFFGGANGSVYLSDFYVLHTPTVTWSTVKLSIPTSLSSSSSSGGAGAGAGGSGGVGWSKIISKRLRPTLLPVTTNQFIIYGGGKVCDLALPSYGDIPSDSYLITLTPLTPYLTIQQQQKTKKNESLSLS